MTMKPYGDKERMSEAEEQALWEIDHPAPRCHACEDGGSQHADQCEFSDRWDPAEHIGPVPEAVAEVMIYRTAHVDPFIDLYRQLYGDQMLSVGFSLLQQLRGKVWHTREGLELTPAEMTTSHAQNLIPWLERRAKPILVVAQLESMVSLANHNGGIHAHNSLEEADAELNEMDSVDFLRTLPLYKAIKTRADEAMTWH